jgi:putative restriction endonuclease
MSLKDNWSREQLIVALNLYCKLGFAKVKYTHPQIIQLAKVIGRTPSAVAYKLVNFARLDPELQKRGVKGMSHGSKGEEEIWNEFYNDYEKLAEVSEPLLAQFKQQPLEVSAAIEVYDLPKEGREREAMVKQRVNQGFFRQMILSLYQNRCCITGIDKPQLLVSSHISKWSDDKANRMNPANGLCLNTLHDKAYESGLISITPDYILKVSGELKRQKKNVAVQEYFLKYENTEISLPANYKPDQSLLEKHLETRFIE